MINSNLYNKRNSQHRTKSLDFIVIGAQKAGTTSLFKYLYGNPGIYMPFVKEAPFFCQDSAYDKGFDSFLEEYYNQASITKLWGKVTPQYLGNPLVPSRIYKTIPTVKLIAILRNPFHRAFSHYKMVVRRGDEKRSFDDAVKELCDEDKAKFARQLTSDLKNEMNCYLVWGEYGRLIQNYLEYFPMENILLLFFDDLETRPKLFLNEILRFLNLDTSYCPENIGKKYHAGGTRTKFPLFYKIIKNQNFRNLSRKIIPFPKLRRTFMYWFEQSLVIPDSNLLISDETIKVLESYYRSDTRLLVDLIGKKVPWVKYTGS